MDQSPPDGPRHFLVELTSRAGRWENVAELAARARSAALAHSRSGGGDVRFVRSVYAPESDSLFLLYRASSSDEVLAVARAADLTPDLVSVPLSVSATEGMP